ncbi:MAG TPA: hypothetical protein VGA96_13795, partial [Fibrella sp.]
EVASQSAASCPQTCTKEKHPNTPIELRLRDDTRYTLFYCRSCLPMRRTQRGASVDRSRTMALISSTCRFAKAV